MSWEELGKTQVKIDPSQNAVQLSGSIPGGTNEIGTTTNKWDVPEFMSRPYSNILSRMGRENVRMMLPLWEGSGDFLDIVHDTVQFTTSGVTQRAIGPFGYCIEKTTTQNPGMKYMGSAIVVNRTPTILTATGKLAVKLPTGMQTGRIAYVMPRLARQGSAPSAKLEAHLHVDNAGVPGDRVGFTTKGGLDRDIIWDHRRRYLPVNNVVTGVSGNYIGIPLQGAFHRRGNIHYWVVIEYSDATGIDESNYVQWAGGTDLAGTASWGNANDATAVWDEGAGSWTVIANRRNEIYLLSDAAGLPDGDWTIIVGGQMTGTTLGYLFRFPALTRGIDANGLGVGADGSLRLICTLEHPNGTEKTLEHYLAYDGLKYNLYGISFSKQGNTEKMKLFVNGQHRFTISGGGGAVIPHPNVGWRLGAGVGVDNAPVNRFAGKFGPLMVFNADLSADDHAFIYGELKSIGNKMGVL